METYHCITLSSSRKKPTQAQEVAGRISGAIAGEIHAKSRLVSRQLANFWRHCQGDLRQVKTYQVPIINSHLLHYIICHSPPVFLSPTSKMIFEKICLFLRPSFVRLLRLPLVAHLLDLFAATMSETGEVIAKNLEEKPESYS